MRVVNEAMTKQPEVFLKMLEDRDTSQCPNWEMREKAKARSGEADDVVVTAEFPMTREKEKISGCSYKTFLECEPPLFVGTANPGKCTYWNRGMEMAFEAIECADS